MPDYKRKKVNRFFKNKPKHKPPTSSQSFLKRRRGGRGELPQNIQTAQKKHLQGRKRILSNELTSQFKWCQF